MGVCPWSNETAHFYIECWPGWSLGGDRVAVEHDADRRYSWPVKWVFLDTQQSNMDAPHYLVLRGSAPQVRVNYLHDWFHSPVFPHLHHCKIPKLIANVVLEKRTKEYAEFINYSSKHKQLFKLVWWNSLDLSFPNICNFYCSHQNCESWMLKSCNNLQGDISVYYMSVSVIHRLWTS